MAEKKFDVLIVGGGAAGLTAAIYARRKELTTAVISVDVGGQNLLTEQEENYPGYTERSGPKLMEIFFSQALKFGTEYIAGKVNKVEKLKEGFKVTLTNGETYESQVVILAHGKVPKSLGIPGEDKFIGRGVSICATCMPPSSLVVVNNSIRPISEVEEDNLVLTHDGSFRRVLAATSREYSGPLIKIRTRMFKEQDLFLTPEHMVLVRTARKVNPTYSNLTSPQWLEAKNLNEKHLLLYPIVREIKDIKEIDVRKIVGREKTKIKKNLVLPKNERFTTKSLPKKIKIDNEFMRLAGYFVSDGSITDRGFNLYFNGKKEQEYANDSAEIIEKKFGLKATVYKEGNVIRVQVYSILIREIFQKIFGKYSYNKQLPHEFLFFPLVKQRHLIKGIWRGDGSIREKDFVINSNSLKLIEQIKNILLRFNIIPGIRKISLEKLKEYGSKINGRKIVFKHDKYEITIAGPSLQKMSEIVSVKHPKIENRKWITHHAMIKDNFAVLPIKKIEVVNYTGPVLNLATENNSYVTPNGIVHNCDAPFYKNKIAVVIGGGNSALEAAELLTKFATKIYLVHRRDAFRGDEITQNKVKAAKNVEIVFNSVPIEVKGKEKLEAVIIEDVNTKKRRELKADGVFVEIGHVLDTEFVKDLVDRNELNEVKANRSMETKTPGIFAAGDVTDGPFKQTVNAASEGAVAALTAYNYLMKKQGRAAIKADWS